MDDDRRCGLRGVAVIEVQKAAESLGLDNLPRVLQSIVRDGDDVVDSLMIALSMVVRKVLCDDLSE